MSVIAKCEDGWLICHRTFINNLYSDVHMPPNLEDDKAEAKLTFNPVYFDIKVPFLMDSAAIKYSNMETKKSDLNTEQIATDKRPRKRKRCAGILQDCYHAEIQPYLRKSLPILVELGHECGYLLQGSPTREEYLENNYPARAAAKRLLHLLFPESRCQSQHNSMELSGQTDLSIANQCIFEHNTEHLSTVTLDNEKYVIPPKCRFILGNVSCLENFSKTGEKFDFILMDPPWDNKSVKRKKGYALLSEESLTELPVKELAAPGCIFAVWATNNQRQIAYVKEELFPKWAVRHVADWHWVKVTTRGEPIHQFDDHQKKPYENLIIGCNAENGSSVKKNFENHKIIASVPSAIHSHKPPLTEILKDYLPQNARCLELFARYLLPGYTSFGNEVILLQNLKLFRC